MAAREVADRLDGKTAQVPEMPHEHKIIAAEPMSEEEWAKRFDAVIVDPPPEPVQVPGMKDRTG